MNARLSILSLLSLLVVISGCGHEPSLKTAPRVQPTNTLSPLKETETLPSEKKPEERKNTKSIPATSTFPPSSPTPVSAPPLVTPVAAQPTQDAPLAPTHQVPQPDAKPLPHHHPVQQSGTPITTTQKTPPTQDLDPPPLAPTAPLKPLYPALTLHQKTEIEESLKKRFDEIYEAKKNRWILVDRPDDFVETVDLPDQIQIQIRYFSKTNFSVFFKTEVEFKQHLSEFVRGSYFDHKKFTPDETLLNLYRNTTHSEQKKIESFFEITIGLKSGVELGHVYIFEDGFSTVLHTADQTQTIVSEKVREKIMTTLTAAYTHLQNSNP